MMYIGQARPTDAFYPQGESHADSTMATKGLRKDASQRKAGREFIKDCDGANTHIAELMDYI